MATRLLMCLLAAASIAATATDVCDEYSFLQARENGAQANGARTKPHAEVVPSLSMKAGAEIAKNCEAAVAMIDSAFRKNASGVPMKVVMQVVIMPREDPWNFVPLVNLGARKADTAWYGSLDMAKGKAFTALGFSSNENALTSRAIGQLAGEGQPFFGIADSNRPLALKDARGIITSPGGIPLYNQQKQLIGAVGVSGDGVDQDEAVALACASGFEAPEAIRGGNPYTNVTNPVSLSIG